MRAVAAHSDQRDTHMDQHPIPDPGAPSAASADNKGDQKAKRSQEPASDISDADLLVRIQQGDGLALQSLIARHAIKFRALAYRIMGDLDQAEDMVQDAFVKLWQRPDRFDASKAKFTTWFYRVVSNRCLDEKRKRRADPLPEGFDRADDRPLAYETLAEAQKAALVRAAVEHLKDRPKLAVTLTSFEGLSNREAADVMEMNIKAFESLLLRARAKLKTLLSLDGKS